MTENGSSKSRFGSREAQAERSRPGTEARKAILENQSGLLQQNRELRDKNDQLTGRNDELGSKNDELTKKLEALQKEVPMKEFLPGVYQEWFEEYLKKFVLVLKGGRPQLNETANKIVEEITVGLEKAKEKLGELSPGMEPTTIEALKAAYKEAVTMLESADKRKAYGQNILDKFTEWYALQKGVRPAERLQGRSQEDLQNDPKFKEAMAILASLNIETFSNSRMKIDFIGNNINISLSHTLK